jgi:RNA methyltransferase, TrmH family
MFPLSKLGELSPRTRLRKIARILQGMEVEAAAGRAPAPSYLEGLLALLEGQLPAQTLAAARSPRGLNALRHEMLRMLHTEPAEWDLVRPETGSLDRSGVEVLPMTLYLEDLRSPFNVGSIFRTAEALGAQRVLLSPRTPLPTHPRAEKTSMGATRALPWEVAELSSLRGRSDVFALELGGTPLDHFHFPRAGVALIGSEELGLSPEALEIAAAGRGRVSIPLAGAKRSLNVSVAAGILLMGWARALRENATT